LPGHRLAALEYSAHAQTTRRSQNVDRFAKFIDAAPDRFAVPARWIRAVTQVQNGGDERAMSSRCAMGWHTGDAFGPRSTRRFAPHRATLRVSRPFG
jgi:hypothetical protein